MGIFYRLKKRTLPSPGTVPYLSGSLDAQFNWPWSTVNPTSEACIRKVVSTISALKIDLYTHRKGGGRALMYAHPLGQALRNPDPQITPMQFYAGVADDIMRGNAYIHIVRMGGAIVLQKLSRPDVVLTAEGGRKLFAYGAERWKEKDVLHIPYPFDLVKVNSSFDVYKGRAPAEKYADLISLDNALHAYIKMYFANSPGKRVVLEAGEKYKDKKADEFYALVAPLLQKYVIGAQNSGKVLIPPADTKLVALDATQNLYSDIKSLKELTERQIAQGYGVPYSLISEQNKYDSLEANQLQLMADTIEPLGIQIEQSFNRLLDPSDTALYCKYDYKAMLQSDLKTTIDYLAKEVASGLLTLNEARDSLDLDAVEAGDLTLIPANLYPLTLANAEAIFAQSKLALHNGAGDQTK